MSLAVFSDAYSSSDRLLYHRQQGCTEMPCQGRAPGLQTQWHTAPSQAASSRLIA